MENMYKPTLEERLDAAISRASAQIRRNARLAGYKRDFIQAPRDMTPIIPIEDEDEEEEDD